MSRVAFAACIAMAAASCGASAEPQACAKSAPPIPASAKAANSTWVYDGMPPERYRGDSWVVVQFLSPDAVNEVCAPRPRQCGVTYEACADRMKITLPNPCDPKFAGEKFATLSCHEAAHYSFGWPATHGE